MSSYLLGEEEHSFEHEAKCPYCDKEYGDSNELNLGDSEGTDVECPYCGKDYYVTGCIEVTYSSQKIICKKSEDSNDK